MSYILDALKKAEEDKRRQQVPDLSTVHYPVQTPKRSMLSYWVSSISLAVLVGIGVYWYLQVYLPGKHVAPLEETRDVTRLITPLTERSDRPQKIVQPAAHSSLQTDAQPTAKHRSTSVPQARPLNSEVPPRQRVSGVPTSTTPARVLQKPTVRPLNNVQRAGDPNETWTKISPGGSITTMSGREKDQYLASTSAAPSGAFADTVEEEREDLPPFLDEMPLHVQQQVPSLSFSSHMYARYPSSRSVIINGRRLREKQRIGDELVLESITENGVIVALNNHRFQINILEDWAVSAQ